MAGALDPYDSALEEEPDVPDLPPNLRSIDLIVVSRTPNTRDYIVAAITPAHNLLAFIRCRPGPIVQEYGPGYFDGFGSTGKLIIKGNRMVPLGEVTDIENGGTVIGQLHRQHNKNLLEMTAINKDLNVFIGNPFRPMNNFIAKQLSFKLNDGNRMRNPVEYGVVGGEGFANVVHINYHSRQFFDEMRKLVLGFAIQALHSRYRCQNMFVPHVILATPRKACYSCKGQTLPSYFSKKSETDSPKFVPSCIVLRMACKESGNDLLDVINGDTQLREFTIECDALPDDCDEDDHSKYPGTARIFNKKHELKYIIKDVRSKTSQLMVYDAEQTLLGYYHNNTIYDEAHTKLANVRVKAFVPSYEHRWGGSSRYFIDPGVAMITRHDCAVAVCYKTKAPSQLLRVLIVALALRLYYNEYKFHENVSANLKYCYDEKEICGDCIVNDIPVPGEP